MRHANPAPVRQAAARFSDAAFLVAALAAVLLTALVAVGARSWIDRPFAGFFLLADRSVPAIGRIAWTETAGARLYDRTLVAIDGAAVADGRELERRIASKPVGASFTYTLNTGSGMDTITLASRRFSASDYWAVFGAYLLTGLLYVLLAIAAAWALPGQRLGHALVLVGGIGGIFLWSAADLYSPPGLSLRLHTLAAALLPAALVQFALVVGDSRGAFTRAALPVVWAVALAAAASMQLAIGDAAATRWMHATSAGALGLALGTATLGLVIARARLGSEASGHFLASAALFGLGVPAAIFLLAGVSGAVPQNAGATLAFLFPLGVGVGLMRNAVTVRALDVARPSGCL
jgi:hypothetical protein